MPTRELQDWLDAQPTGTVEAEAETRRRAVALAHRAAMRAVPVLLARFHLERSPERDLAVIAALRSNLISGIAAAGPTQEIGFAADAARNATDGACGVIHDSVRRVYLAATAAAHAAGAAAATDAADSFREVYNAANSAAQVVADDIRVASFERLQTGAAYVAHAAFDYSRIVNVDIVALGQGISIQALPLWPERNNPIASTWREARTRLVAMGDGWDFWASWYDKALAGQPQDWQLLTEIALIPPEDWDRGPEHVNTIIAGMVRKRGSGVPRPDDGTIKVIQRAVATNAAAILLQLTALIQIIDEEHERLRGDNGLDPEIRQRLLAIFQRMRDAAVGIGRAVPEHGAPDAPAAEEIGTWAMELKQEAMHWNVEAKKVVRGREADSRVALGTRIVLGATVAGVLTAIGLPNYAAVAGSAIVLSDGIRDLGKILGSKIAGGG